MPLPSLAIDPRTFYALHLFTFVLYPFIPPFTQSTLSVEVVLEAGTTKESKTQ